MITEQMDKWSGTFGREYTDRNTLSLDELENLCKSQYGYTRTEINKRFLDNLDRSMRILEVGANTGNQLLCLQQMGFHNLYGIELQSYAVEIAKSRAKRVNIIEGSIFDIPFKDDYFDLVFTSGVLIHISPTTIADGLKEIHRCSRDYIWGLEYFADVYTKVSYRGHEELLWKTDFAKLYTEQFDDLKLVKEERLSYLDNDNVDTVFLLKKNK